MGKGFLLNNPVVTTKIKEVTELITSHSRIPATYGNLGHVKIGDGITVKSGSVSVKFGDTAGTACMGNDTRLNNARTPVPHASSDTSYGLGTDTNYGHVKLLDTPSEKGNAASGIGASSKALYTVYNKYATEFEKTRSDFQAGVDTLRRDVVVAGGWTPSGNQITPSDVTIAINYAKDFAEERAYSEAYKEALNNSPEYTKGYNEAYKNGLYDGYTVTTGYEYLNSLLYKRGYEYGKAQGQGGNYYASYFHINSNYIYNLNIRKTLTSSDVTKLVAGIKTNGMVVAAADFPQPSGYLNETIVTNGWTSIFDGPRYDIIFDNSSVPLDIINNRKASITVQFEADFRSIGYGTDRIPIYPRSIKLSKNFNYNAYDSSTHTSRCPYEPRYVNGMKRSTYIKTTSSTGSINDHTIEIGDLSTITLNGSTYLVASIITSAPLIQLKDPMAMSVVWFYKIGYTDNSGKNNNYVTAKNSWYGGAGYNYNPDVYIENAKCQEVHLKLYPSTYDGIYRKSNNSIKLSTLWGDIAGKVYKITLVTNNTWGSYPNIDYTSSTEGFSSTANYYDDNSGTITFNAAGIYCLAVFFSGLNHYVLVYVE